MSYNNPKSNANTERIKPIHIVKTKKEEIVCQNVSIVVEFMLVVLAVRAQQKHVW